LFQFNVLDGESHKGGFFFLPHFTEEPQGFFQCQHDEDNKMTNVTPFAIIEKATICSTLMYLERG
jgi:hypothetical protein